MKKIQILLIEDNRFLRDGIASMLKKQPDMNVIAVSSGSENILKVMEKFKPNIVLLDIGQRNQDSLNILKLSKLNYPDTKVIVMDMIPPQAEVLEFIKAGVSGFILKDANISEFYRTIRIVHKGVQVLPPNLTSSLFSQIVEHTISAAKSSENLESVRLTKREQQVIKLISDGLTNKEIAQKLQLSTYTVKSHVHNILEKLTLHTRVQIAKYAHFSDSYGCDTDSQQLIS